MSYKNLRTVKQVAESNSGVWTEASLRWLIFNRKKNGFDSVLVEPPGRVLIDIVRFDEWLESYRPVSDNQKTRPDRRGAA